MNTAEEELPFCPQSPGDGPGGRFSAYPRTLHKGSSSSSKSSQSTTSKDNSAVVEDAGINASDGSKALRDDAKGIEGKGNQIVEQEFAGEAQIVEGNLDIGDGNSFTTSDPEVSKAAIEAAGKVAGDSFGFARATVEESFDLGKKSQDSITETFNDLIQFSQITQAEANELTRETNDVLAKKSSDADSAVSETLQKNILIGIALAGIVIAVRGEK